MKLLVGVFFLTTALFSQSSENPIKLKSGSALEKQVDKLSNNAKTKETKSILILTAQGVDPTIDTIGYNEMVKNVTQAFSAKLQPLLEEEGKTVNNVIDQNFKMQAGQKVAYYSNEHSADATIALTLNTSNSQDDTILSLRVQYFDLVYTTTDGKVSSVLTSNEIKKDYTLKSSKKGVSKLTMTDLAADFCHTLKESKRL